MSLDHSQDTRSDPSLAPVCFSRTLLDAERYGRQGYPYEDWARLRRETPVSYVVPERGIPYWAVTRHRDIVWISRQPERFTNWPRFKAGLGSDEIAQARTLSSMDPPEHRLYRQIVSRQFTPRALARMRDPIEAVTLELMEGLGEEGGTASFDFVERIAAPLPILIIAWLLGLPRSDWNTIFHLTNAMTGFADPEYQREGETLETTIVRARSELYAYFADIAKQRRARPGEDLISRLATARVDGRPIAEAELMAYYLILVVAGNETTRNALSGGIKAFADHPEQWRTLLSDDRLLGNAVEEILRFTSPVVHHARTAAEDVEIAGARIRRGDTLAMFYPSANRDEALFEDPNAFRITRERNPHLAFGVGEHVCLGAHLARVEVELVVRHLARRVDHIEQTGPVSRLASVNVGGVKQLPVRFHFHGSDVARGRSSSRPRSAPVRAPR